MKDAETHTTCKNSHKRSREEGLNLKDGDRPQKFHNDECSTCWFKTQLEQVTNLLLAWNITCSKLQLGTWNYPTSRFRSINKLGRGEGLSSKQESKKLISTLLIYYE